MLLGFGYRKMIMVYCFGSKKVGKWLHILIFESGAVSVGICKAIARRWLDIEAQVQSCRLPHPPLRLVYYPLAFLLSTHHCAVVSSGETRKMRFMFFLLLLTVRVSVGIHIIHCLFTVGNGRVIFLLHRARPRGMRQVISGDDDYKESHKIFFLFAIFWLG